MAQLQKATTGNPSNEILNEAKAEGYFKILAQEFNPSTFDQGQTYSSVVPEICPAYNSIVGIVVNYSPPAI